MNPVSSQQFLSLEEASTWASSLLAREVTVSNISYLIQYGKVRKHNIEGETRINSNDLANYYESFRGKREIDWKKKLGDDLNWELSFDHLREKDTTKHVHRLHPYKGKYIPQLVEYFIDQHVDKFKKEVFFRSGDIVLDPFTGSGTTLVQANELGLDSIGVDVSRFNCMISEVKLIKYDFVVLEETIQKIHSAVIKFEFDSRVRAFEEELLELLNKFNITNFPNPEYKYQLNNKKIEEDEFAKNKEKEFLKIYNNLTQKYGIKLNNENPSNFLDKWFIESVRKEIDFAFDQIKKIKDPHIKKILAVILSRTVRSCRATTHSDLATLKYPQLTTYYCYKHKKICKPIFSIKSMFSRYAFDTIARLKEFDRLRKNVHSAIVAADSRTVNLENEIKKRSKSFHDKYKKNKIKGIFTSPPYVGQIDYHEQHAYAYDLLGFERKDELEIGPLYKRQGVEARESYVRGISDVLINCRSYLTNDFEVFLVANDKFNLYPKIAELSNMKIVNQYKRPVLNRTERDKSPYSEIIFHFKRKD